MGYFQYGFREISSKKSKHYAPYYYISILKLNYFRLLWRNGLFCGSTVVSSSFIKLCLWPVFFCHKERKIIGSLQRSSTITQQQWWLETPTAYTFYFPITASLSGGGGWFYVVNQLWSENLQYNGRQSIYNIVNISIWVGSWQLFPSLVFPKLKKVYVKIKWVPQELITMITISKEKKDQMFSLQSMNVSVE